MLRSITHILALAVLTIGCANAEGEFNKAQIMVLGTYHFTGGGSDMINPEVDDNFSERRQEEISEILDRLESFSPTIIAVEDEPARQESLMPDTLRISRENFS